MANFEKLSDLPQATRVEIARIQAIPSAQRITKDANFLTALAPYLNNQVIFQDADDLIVIAAGNTLPTDYEGFKKGALFIKLDAAGNGLYVNVGDETAGDWEIVNTGA